MQPEHACVSLKHTPLSLAVYQEVMAKKVSPGIELTKTAKSSLIENERNISGEAQVL